MTFRSPIGWASDALWFWLYPLLLLSWKYDISSSVSYHTTYSSFVLLSSLLVFNRHAVGRRLNTENILSSSCLSMDSKIYQNVRKIVQMIVYSIQIGSIHNYSQLGYLYSGFSVNKTFKFMNFSGVDFTCAMGLVGVYCDF